MVNVFEYDLSNLSKSGLKWNANQSNDFSFYCTSSFDKLLLKSWNSAVKASLFKYTLEGCQYKVLCKSSMQFVAQLNTQRGFNRRKHESFDSMNAPFKDGQFNFTKIKQEEKLLTLYPGKNTALGSYYKEFSSLQDHVISINVSPIDNCHVLLIPELSKGLWQKLTLTSLLLAFDLIQLSNHPGFRVGFNSLHAWASINHLHFHAMYLNYPLFIDDHPATVNVKSHCYLLDECAMRGIIFNVPTALDERLEVAKEALEIVEYLHKKEIPYNVLITRGNCGTRMILVPRKSTKNREKSPCFDVACVEIGGHFPIKTEEEFESLTFDKAYEFLAYENLSENDFGGFLSDISLLL